MGGGFFFLFFVFFFGGGGGNGGGGGAGGTRQITPGRILIVTGKLYYFNHTVCFSR